MKDERGYCFLLRKQGALSEAPQHMVVEKRSQIHLLFNQNISSASHQSVQTLLGTSKVYTTIMHLRLLLILQLLTVLHVTKAQSALKISRACVAASKDCEFEFEGFEGRVATFRIGKADVPLTTRIVSKDPSEILGVLNSNGMTPEVITSDFEAIPITNFGEPPFTPTHAKPFSLPRGGSGIGHQTLTGNQLEISRGACVRVFFSSYQLIIGPKPTDVRNINARKRDFKCAVLLVE